MAALVGWAIVGHLIAWMLALPATALGPSAGLMALVLGGYVGLRDRRQVLAGFSVALLTIGVSLLVIRGTILSGFPDHQVGALQKAITSLLIGLMLGLLVRGSRRKRTESRGGSV